MPSHGPVHIATRNGNVLQKCRQDNFFNDKDNMKMVLLPKNIKALMYTCANQNGVFVLFYEFFLLFFPFSQVFVY
jgi:hypothetical protein